MKKGIKKMIIGLCISVFLLIISIFVFNGISLLGENSNNIILRLIVSASVVSIIGCSAYIIAFLIVIIGLNIEKANNKKADEYNKQIEEETRNKLPK